MKRDPHCWGIVKQPVNRWSEKPPTTGKALNSPFAVLNFNHNQHI